MARPNLRQAVSEYESTRNVFVALAEKVAAAVHEMLVIEGVNFQLLLGGLERSLAGYGSTELDHA